MRDNIRVNGVVKQIKSVLFEGKRYVIKGKGYSASDGSAQAIQSSNSSDWSGKSECMQD